jgi:hypothetical protein
MPLSAARFIPAHPERAMNCPGSVTENVAMLCREVDENAEA